MRENYIYCITKKTGKGIEMRLHSLADNVYHSSSCKELIPLRWLGEEKSTKTLFTWFIYDLEDPELS